MNPKNSLSFERANELLCYDRETGEFSWKIARKGASKGRQAGTINGLGYRQIMMDGITYLAHRIAWLIATGRHPVDQIDHINGEKSDNRIANLREASCSENLRNIKISAVNTSGMKGVSLEKSRGRFQGQVRLNGVRHRTARFHTAEEANTATIILREHLHGSFVNHG